MSNVEQYVMIAAGVAMTMYGIVGRDVRSVLCGLSCIAIGVIFASCV